MGLNGQSFYRLDPRLPGEKQVSSRRFVTPSPSNRWSLNSMLIMCGRYPSSLLRCSYMYGKSAPALSCMATTENGHMVMGSRKGEIRLFSDKTFSRDIDPLARLKPRAKTTLPGLGGTSPVLFRLPLLVASAMHGPNSGVLSCACVRRPHHRY